MAKNKEERKSVKKATSQNGSKTSTLSKSQKKIKIYKGQGR